MIFSRFGPILSCEVIRDKRTGDSLQYAFIEFEHQKDCEQAYFKMQGVLIDDHRIHVDFSQSVRNVQWSLLYSHHPHVHLQLRLQLPSLLVADTDSRSPNYPTPGATRLSPSANSAAVSAVWPISSRNDSTGSLTTPMEMTRTLTIWFLIAHAGIDPQRLLHLHPVATAGPIAVPGGIHIVIGAAVAVLEAETHITTGTGGEILAEALGDATLSGGTEIAAIEVAIGMTVGIVTGTGIGVVETTGMSGDDEGQAYDYRR